MSNAQHTPGPWEFYLLRDAANDGFGYIRSAPHDGLEIAHLGDAGRSRAENIANGVLMHADPTGKITRDVEDIIAQATRVP